MSFIYTEPGINDKHPISLNGKQIQEFYISKNGRRLLSKDDESIYIDNMSISEAFINKSNIWLWNENKASSRLQTLWGRSVTNLKNDGKEELYLAAFRSLSKSFLIYSYSFKDATSYPALFYMNYTSTNNQKDRKRVG